MITEALALQDGVILANLQGFANVVLETDILDIANLWNTRLNSRSVVASGFVIQHVN